MRQQVVIVQGFVYMCVFVCACVCTMSGPAEVPPVRVCRGDTWPSLSWSPVQPPAEIIIVAFSNKTVIIK